MAQITYVSGDVRPLQGALVERAIVNEVMHVGDSVYVDGSSGDLPTIKMTAEAALATGNAFGVVVAGDPARYGATTLAVGDAVDVVVFGRVSGYTGTAGGFAWAGDTAGQIVDAVGTKSMIIGQMLTTGILFVRPAQAVRAA